MVKRSPTEAPENAVLSPQKAAALSTADATKPQPRDATKATVDEGMDVDMGPFEDAYGDEQLDEDEGEVVDCASDNERDEDMMTLDEFKAQADQSTDTPMDADGDGQRKVPGAPRVYLPGQALEKDEQLEVDQSAYVMLHTLETKWPCLSFDFLPTPQDQLTTAFPLTAYAVTGSQADMIYRNEVTIMKMSDLHKTQVVDKKANRTGDDSDSESDDDDDDEQGGGGIDQDPILEVRTCKHEGGVNRIRANNYKDKLVAATWADTGKVHVWDIHSHVKALSVPGAVAPPSAQKPIYTIASHGRSEGFALDWSPTEGQLLTGDVDAHIYLTNRDTQSGAFRPDRTAFRGHTSSIEDLQWSPTEKTVFASASADQTVRIWDCRQKKKSALTVQAHDTDVNVISWNHNTAYLLASGSDDGVFSIWDLRSFSARSEKHTPVATFKWHHAPITSIEWHPKEESVLAVSGADDQITLWDLSVEHDAEEMQEMNAATQVEVPPQLLFIHQGQQHIKEVHWHPQLPGVLMSTAQTGLNIFQTISV
ncbi:Ribosome assembly protein rrb1 [Tieghemiomyces parasiticus]|uniref:Glutamate-rich WD repeat-containing protein 1 n=1 Tax=Tieghemiomyces parasiticus TaxID=78921 RepID=A0A9W8AHZ7_9FUNG|nr:Ribosome assembly protein rrb1 [Tieghemiomyces parasiticus]